MRNQFFQTIGPFRKTAPFRCHLQQISDTKDVLYSEYQLGDVYLKKKRTINGCNILHNFNGYIIEIYQRTFVSNSVPQQASMWC